MAPDPRGSSSQGQNGWEAFRRLVERDLDQFRDDQNALEERVRDLEQAGRDSIHDLTDEEIKRFRKIANEWELYQKLWGLVIRFVGWGIAVVAITWSARDFIGQLVHMFGKWLAS